jgi:hypothetical protein
VPISDEANTAIVSELISRYADLRFRVFTVISQESLALTPSLLLEGKLKVLRCVSPERGIQPFCFGGAVQRNARRLAVDPTTVGDGAGYRDALGRNPGSS